MKGLEKKDCFIVRKQDKAARELMIKLCKNAKPGSVIFVSDDEFNSLKDSVIRIEV